ncbi:hypothetical protein NHQ30_011589 [Ciborinia camelliae]|nr:hypothetical protein NHQ30_011589 [Ciborinia camelliae]
MVPATFPNLRNITYYQVRHYHTEPCSAQGDYGAITMGGTRRLIKFFRAFPVSESIEVILDDYFTTWFNAEEEEGEVKYSDYNDYEMYATDTPRTVPHLQFEVQEGIRHLLMPTSLLYGNINDLPPDLGLRSLEI